MQLRQGQAHAARLLSEGRAAWRFMAERQQCDVARSIPKMQPMDPWRDLVDMLETVVNNSGGFEVGDVLAAVFDG
jgi:hypothetical protein